jgi:hypothetical protein
MAWGHAWKIQVSYGEWNMGSWIITFRWKKINCKWVYKSKCNATKGINIYNVKLCVKGYPERNGVDYTKILSLVMKFDSIGIVLWIVTINNLNIMQFDIKVTFYIWQHWKGDFHGVALWDWKCKQPNCSL